MLAGFAVDLQVACNFLRFGFGGLVGNTSRVIMRVETLSQGFLEGKTGPRAPLRLKFEDTKGEVVLLTGVGDESLAVHADFQFPRVLSI